MLINSSYFVGEYEIMNIAGSAPVVAGNVAKLNAFIAKYEPEFLRALLGSTMYDEFTAGLLINPIPAKWSALSSKITATTAVTAFVWNRYWTSEETKTSSLGQLLSKAENAQVVSSNTKLVRSWNDSMFQAAIIYDWLNQSAQLTTYPTKDTDEDFFYLTNYFGI